jgi:hypothetical protein
MIALYGRKENSFSGRDINKPEQGRAACSLKEVLKINRPSE